MLYPLALSPTDHDPIVQNDNFIGSEGATALAPALQTMTGLQRLDLVCQFAAMEHMLQTLACAHNYQQLLSATMQQH